jgi:GT2 family glycosyltransferase
MDDYSMDDPCMAEDRKVGVVTVTYNSAQVLPDFLRSLWSQTHQDFMLYAVDNASKDSTLDQLRAEPDRRLTIKPSPSNLGVAEGNNVGIRAALEDGCDAVLLINNDVAFPPNLISTLLESQQAHRSHMVAPKMMYHEPSNIIWWAGGHFQPALGYRVVHEGLNQLDLGQRDQAIPAEYSPTCCVLIRREVFAKIGLMDAKYFVYCDDTDFMLRAHKAGLVLYYEPAAVLYHKVGSLTKPSESPFVVHLLARNRVYFWLKHLGKPLACFYTASLSLIYLAKYCLRLKPGPILKIQLKAMLDGFRLA